MDKKGSVLIIVLWIVAILVIFTVGLGYRASLDLRLARYQREGLKARYLAKAGVNLALAELNKDLLGNTFDALTESWADNQEKFSKIILTENELEYAVVSYPAKDGEIKYGVSDEEAKLNINKLDIKMLTQLFIHAGYPDDALALANTIYEWISSAKEADENKKLFKNAQLNAPEELLLILEYFFQGKEEDYRKKAKEVYSQIKGLFTVYGDGKVNINTVSADVLTILAEAESASVNPDAVANLVAQIVAYRESETGPFKDNALKDNFLTDSEENDIFNSIKSSLKCNSQYFKIMAAGYTSSAAKNLSVVVKRGAPFEITYWHEN